MTPQSYMNQIANDAICATLLRYPDATLEDVVNGLRDAIADAPDVYEQAVQEDAA